MPKALIANPSAMPPVNVMFLGHLALVKRLILESMHLDEWSFTPIKKASESNGGLMQDLMLDNTVERKLHKCYLGMNCR